MDNLTAIAQLQPWSKSVEVALLLQYDNYFCSAEPLVMVKREPFIPISPSFTLSPKATQQLMDDLWRCGFRPSEGEGSAGQLASVKYHLEDMRKLVFKGDDKC